MMTNKEKSFVTKMMVYEKICEYFLKHLYSPTYDELLQMTTLKSKQSVNNYIKRLLDDGYLECDYDYKITIKPRAFRPAWAKCYFKR